MIGTTAMILVNVGLSIFNSLANSRNNDQIRKKREEYYQASIDGDRQRMLRILREGQEMTRKMEDERHKQKLDEIDKQLDQLIEEFAYEEAIVKWPLKTLPIVMKNQTLGNRLVNKNENVSLHCILTPSNCSDFNLFVLPKVEHTLEEYCNQHWSPLVPNANPILFYSGAWKTYDAPTGVETDSLQTSLSSLPMLLITPYFRSKDGSTQKKLVFRIHTWGLGEDHQKPLNIPEIEPTEFQRDYHSDMLWAKEDGLIEEAVEDIVPYLECLIGFIADSYFWSAFGSVPQLPHLLTNGTINTDGMKYLIEDTRKNYDKLLEQGKREAKYQPFAADKLLCLIDGAGNLWSEGYKNQKLNEILDDYINRNIHNTNNGTVLTILDEYFINNCLKVSKHWKDRIENLQLEIRDNHPQSYKRTNFPERLNELIPVDELSFETVLDEFIQYCNYTKLKDVSLLIEQESLRTFSFNTYDYESDCITFYPYPFNRKYEASKIAHVRNINNIFNGGRIKEISCHINRLNILKEKIIDNNLTY